MASRDLSKGLLADDPVGESDPDLLDRKPFISAVLTVLERVRREADSSVLGLIGPWGSGKTSLLGLVAAATDRGRWQPVFFNPWEVSDLESIVRTYFWALAEGIPRSKQGDRLRRAMGSGIAAAMLNFGVLLEGRGETGEAESWYRRAAEGGYVEGS